MLPVCAFDAVCPCGAKALQSGAPDFGWFAGQRWMKKRFALQERSGRRAGKTGKRSRIGLSALFFANIRRGEALKIIFLPLSHPLFSRNHPAGRPAGSARTRPRDQSLGNPFLGNRRFLRRPVPQRRRRQAPARGPAAVYSLYRPLRNETQHPRPIRDGAGMRRLRAKGAVSRHCRRRPVTRTGPRPLRSRPRPRR